MTDCLDVVRKLVGVSKVEAAMAVVVMTGSALAADVTVEDFVRT